MSPPDLSYLATQHISSTKFWPELKDCSCMADVLPPSRALSLAHLFLSWTSNNQPLLQQLMEQAFGSPPSPWADSDMTWGSCL